MLMFQPKWFKISEHIKVGDIVLFLKHDSVLSSTYQYGIVTAVDESQEGLIRKLHVKYRNQYEDFDRETFRSVRLLVKIHRVDELDILEELAESSRIAVQRMQNENQNQVSNTTNGRI